MIKTLKSKINLLSSEAVIVAESILRDKKKLSKLIRSASIKTASVGNNLKSVKNELYTLIDLIKAWARGSYRQIPWSTLLLLTGAVIYFVNPFDAIPDILPAAGFLDDATVIGLVLASAKEEMERFKKWQATDGGGSPDPVAA